MNQERLTAVCSSHRIKSKLIMQELPADGSMPPTWATLLTYDGPAEAFDRPAWIDLREAVIAEMRAQGYDPQFWCSISDDRQHGMAWVRRGTPANEFGPMAWHPGFQLRRQRLADHACVACGHDLSAAPLRRDRCPACGAMPAPPE